jgi:hypothetical protein
MLLGTIVINKCSTNSIYTQSLALYTQLKSETNQYYFSFLNVLTNLLSANLILLLRLLLLTIRKATVLQTT